MIQQLHGDCRETLKTLDAGSVQCVVTSPPYFGLRDYGADGQIGLEQTPAEYVAALVAVFAEVWRVLRDDGVLWLNLGDSYAATGGPQVNGTKQTKGSQDGAWGGKIRKGVSGVKPKDLIGIPWRVAFALQDAGWYLRSDVIWNKPNCMPESVTDRPTRAHEYIFLLTKRERYFYNADAVREPHTPGSGGYQSRYQQGKAIYSETSKQRSSPTVGHGAMTNDGHTYNPAGRNRRTVWTVPTTPYSGAHFATFPEALIEPCILAGTSPQACEHCGAPWAPVVERGDLIPSGKPRGTNGKAVPDWARQSTNSQNKEQYYSRERIQTGYAPTCRCENTGSGRCVVLDPFGGSGTTGRVALRHNRRAILCELNPAYIALQDQRTNGVQTMMEVGV